MNKTQLKEFAVWSKAYLEEQIRFSCTRIGITEEEIRQISQAGQVYQIEGLPEVYDGDFASKRKQLVTHIQTDEFGLNHLIEEVAYTWFNRLVALRYMELNDYLPHGYRVLSSKISGQVETDLLKNIQYIGAEIGVDASEIKVLLNSNKLEEAFRKVLLKQCNSLYDVLPMLFEEDKDYTELLLPTSLLAKDAFVDRLVRLDRDNFDSVEIIGWLYQYYISTKKEEVFSGMKNNTKVNKDTLPAATQIFTPDWIVRYMVDNSLGKLWLDSYPSSSVKGQLEYYLEPAEQTPEVQAELDNLIDKNLKVEDIKFLEPCAGSGHILVYAFDVFYQLYQEQGYRKSDIPTLILKNNLFGLDIDKRAAQLAAFSLMMKSRSVDLYIFAKKPKMHVYEIIETNQVDKGLLELINPDKVSKEDIQRFKIQMRYLLDLFKDAKLYGSLLEVENHIDYETLYRVLETEQYSTIGGGYYEVYQHIIQQAEVLDRKYDVVVTNPPYVNNSSLGQIAPFIEWKYPRTSTDLFSVFIERNFKFGKAKAYLGFMTPYVWMFLKSYFDLRKIIIEEKSVSTLIQLEYSGFEEATVPICTFVLRNHKIEQTGEYIRLSDFRGGINQSIKTLEAIQNRKCGYRYTTKASIYSLIPGNPIAYWVSDKITGIFELAQPLNEFAQPKQGMSTCDVNRFIRLWYEVRIDMTNIYCLDNIDNWVTYNKGGDYRKWFGNREHLVLWKSDGENLLNNNATLRNRKFYFKEFIAWTKISSSETGFRDFGCGFLFDGAGGSLFLDNNLYKKYFLGFLNSKVCSSILKVISPTINFNESHIGALPLLIVEVEFSKLNLLVKTCISIAKTDWDSFETSWDFEKHPLLKYPSQQLSESFGQWESFAAIRILKLPAVTRIRKETLNRSSHI
ncbi:MAG: restriction enzyme [Erysipelotrichaceae bacterium]|nr:MAG: restriction enzyme [Erysipelotrichaceae bacterium]